MKNSNNLDLLSLEDEPPSEKSFVDFYIQNRKRYYNFLKSKDLRGAEDDIIQNTAIVVLKAIREKKINTSLDKFIWGVLWNTMYGHYRKIQKTAIRKDDEVRPDGSVYIRSKNRIIVIALDEHTLRTTNAIVETYEDLEILSFRRNRIKRMFANIQDLPEADETLIVDKIMRGLSYKEIALSLGISVSNAKVRLMRIKIKIKKATLLQEQKNEIRYE